MHSMSECSAPFASAISSASCDELLGHSAVAALALLGVGGRAEGEDPDDAEQARREQGSHAHGDRLSRR